MRNVRKTTDDRAGVSHSNSRHRGMTIIYLAVAMFALMGLCSLAVDFAHVQVTKNELHLAADAAAEYGALGLPNGSAAAIANAITAAGDNNVDGSPMVLLASDVQVGNWNTSLTPNFSTARTPQNAIQVTCARTASRGNATSLLFASVLGRGFCDESVTSTALVTTSAYSALSTPVQASQDPWLAGMATGTIANNPNPHNDPDYAALLPLSTVQQEISNITGSSGSYTIAGSGIVWNTSSKPTIATFGSSASYYPASSTSASPQPAIGLPLTPGTALTFDDVSGNANYNLQSPTGTPDGDTTNIMSDIIEGENGMSNIKAPVDSLIGVFLSDADPSTTAAPADLDFSTDAERNFTSISPLLKQTFFIGDGRTDAGNPQQFVVPPGATRLFIGNMDAYEWSNDIGSFSITIHNASKVSLVQ
jgi:Flp pilus assembly protein TadG